MIDTNGRERECHLYPHQPGNLEHAEIRAEILRCEAAENRILHRAYEQSYVCQFLQLDAKTVEQEVDLKNAIQVELDDLALNSDALHHLSLHRRQTLRSTIDPQFRSSCGKIKSEPTDFLFGKELVQSETLLKALPQRKAKKCPFLGKRGAHQRSRPGPSKQPWNQYRQRQTPKPSKSSYK